MSCPLADYFRYEKPKAVGLARRALPKPKAYKMQRSWLKWVLIWMSAVWGLSALLYVLDPQHYDIIFKAKYQRQLGWVVCHGFFGVLSLIIGSLLVTRTFRWHRLGGYLYLGSIGLAGPTGLRLALGAEGGPMARLGFTLLAVLWMSSALKAWNCARQRDFESHRLWMIRNFALTFSAVMLRIYLQGFQLLGGTFSAIYPIAAWLSWLPNLLLAEYFWGRAGEGASALSGTKDDED